MPAWGEGEHPWQRGLTLMQGAINGVDCWNERPNLPGYGRTAQDAISISHHPLSLVIASENTWYEGDRPLMTDSRWYRLFDSGRAAVVLDIALVLKAAYGAVAIGDTREGGFLCIRVNPSMNAMRMGRCAMRMARPMRPGAGHCRRTGWIIRPRGRRNGGFCDFDHPQNFRYPTTWHVRGYGLFAPNCWSFSRSPFARWRVHDVSLARDRAYGRYGAGGCCESLFGLCRWAACDVGMRGKATTDERG